MASNTYEAVRHVVFCLGHVHDHLRVVHELLHHVHRLDSGRRVLFRVPIPIFVVPFPFAVDFCLAICPVISALFEWPAYCIVLAVVIADRQ